jgi:hypothetical protein
VAQVRRGRENGILKSDDGKIVGINLGSDFTAEHEWGIKGLREKFGIPDKGYGLAKRTITQMPSKRDPLAPWHSKKTVPCIYLIEEKHQTLLIVTDYFEPEKYDLNHMDIGRYDKKDDRLQTAWDEKSFGINAATDEDRQAVRDVYAAMQKNDLAVWLGGGGVFKNAGLVLAIASLIPQENATQLYDADVDYENLQKAAEKTGIAKKLADANRRYYALSPKWAGEIKSTKDGEIKTKHPVIFWLNPQDQQDNAYGWFTVEDLELWALGKGPIPGNGRDSRAQK